MAVIRIGERLVQAVFTIRRATATDAASLPAIERSAGEAFREIAHLAWIADGDVLSVERHLELIETGTTWVAAAARGELVGFLCADSMDGALHILEMAVRRDLQAQGLGRRLIATARSWALDHGVPAITLTTFRDVPWNAPFYRSMGFEILGSETLPAPLNCILLAEAAAGLPRDERCAMILTL